jgi:hypothetical protein
MQAQAIQDNAVGYIQSKSCASFGNFLASQRGQPSVQCLHFPSFASSAASIATFKIGFKKHSHKGLNIHPTTNAAVSSIMCSSP